jgi:Superinfection immunity protein
MQMTHHSISKLAATAAVAFATSPAFAHAATSSATTAKDSALLMLLMIAIVLAIYLLPTIIGAKRGVRYVQALCIVNLFTGWTIVGWFGCIIWALAARSIRQPPRPILVRDGQHWRVHHITPQTHRASRTLHAHTL